MPSISVFWLSTAPLYECYLRNASEKCAVYKIKIAFVNFKLGDPNPFGTSANMCQQGFQNILCLWKVRESICSDNSKKLKQFLNSEKFPISRKSILALRQQCTHFLQDFTHTKTAFKPEKQFFASTVEGAALIRGCPAFCIILDWKWVFSYRHVIPSLHHFSFSKHQFHDLLPIK